MSQIKLITFDLDNTLWNIDSQISLAEESLYSWLCQEVTSFSHHYSFNDLRLARQDHSKHHQRLKNRRSLLRVQSLQQQLLTCGLTEQNAYKTAVAAFNEFLTKRSDINLFEGVKDMLEYLSTRYQLVVITNGNADLIQIGLAHWFDALFYADHYGLAKPHPKIFEAALHRCDALPSESIHIGDHCHEDIIAAQNVGMHTIWFNSLHQSWIEDKTRPIIEVQEITQIVDAINTIKKHQTVND